MCSGAVVIWQIREEYVAQVLLAEDDDMIKTFPSDRTNQPFRMWRLWCGWPVTNAHSAKPPGKNFAADPVAVADDVPRWAFPAARFGELPGNPFGSRV
jgi:hypothetical protein